MWAVTDFVMNANNMLFADYLSTNREIPGPSIAHLSKLTNVCSFQYTITDINLFMIWKLSAKDIWDNKYFDQT